MTTAVVCARAPKDRERKCKTMMSSSTPRKLSVGESEGSKIWVMGDEETFQISNQTFWGRERSPPPLSLFYGKSLIFMVILVVFIEGTITRQRTKRRNGETNVQTASSLRYVILSLSLLSDIIIHIIYACPRPPPSL